MTHVALTTAFGLAILAVPFVAEAQPALKIHRIGILGEDNAPPPGTPSPLPSPLRELGYVEGKNVVFERRYAHGGFERLGDLAQELVRLNVDVIVAPRAPAIKAAQTATKVIPIVMVVPGDPVRLGLVANLARPGGNTTGLSTQSVDAVLLTGSAAQFAQRTRVAELAVKSRLPTTCWIGDYVKGGCLMPYGVNIGHLWQRAAYFVDKILKGAKPADLPVEQPTKFELVINAKTAKALSLTIPPSLLLRADQIVE